ncbi:MAG: type IV pilus assembly protein PilM [Candidatus Paceibacterota bacterium]|jgi:type IV pilus assembly protein PilM
MNTSHGLHTSFPVPRFLALSSVGIDISDTSVKFTSLKETKTGLELRTHGHKNIPSDVVTVGIIKDPIQLEKILKEIKQETGISCARVTLPEEQAYIFALNLPKLKLSEIRNAIELQLEENIPLPASEAIFDYEFIEESDTSYKVQISALPRTIVDSYVAVLESAGFISLSFELEAQAITRAVVPKGDDSTMMIIDFGAMRTGISVVSKGIVRFMSTVDIGGIALTNMIKKGLSIDFEHAEELKKENGLLRNSANKELFSILLNSVSILRDEINRHYIYWHTHKDESGNDREKINRIILCGGDAHLPGLLGYLTTSMRTKVELANIWSNINSLEHYSPKINFGESLIYSTALGLALRDFYHD